MTTSQDPWESGASWWLDTIADDPIYQSDVLPLLEALMSDVSGPWLDIGCGDGRAFQCLPPDTIGCDVAPLLLSLAAQRMPVVRCRLPDLGWLRAGALGGASLVLVLEHLVDLEAMLAQAHRAIRRGGNLVVVINHPSFTAPGAGPVVDLADGEVLWRWGPYFEQLPVVTNLGDRDVVFHHRPLGALLTAAASAGWLLERFDERPLSAAAVVAEPGYAGQQHVPRLAGLRWRC